MSVRGPSTAPAAPERPRGPMGVARRRADQRFRGSGEPEREVPPEELFERLKPFKDRVADDIRGDPE